MIDSILYWIQAYNIDGFRFDLMGLHDVETMNAIRQAVDAIDHTQLLQRAGNAGVPACAAAIGGSSSAERRRSSAEKLPMAARTSTSVR